MAAAGTARQRACPATAAALPGRPPVAQGVRSWPRRVCVSETTAPHSSAPAAFSAGGLQGATSGASGASGASGQRMHRCCSLLLACRARVRAWPCWPPLAETHCCLAITGLPPPPHAFRPPVQIAKVDRFRLVLWRHPRHAPPTVPSGASCAPTHTGCRLARHAASPCWSIQRSISVLRHAVTLPIFTMAGNVPSRTIWYSFERPTATRSRTSSTLSNRVSATVHPHAVMAASIRYRATLCKWIPS